jgi:glycerate dehydrogenase
VKVLNPEGRRRVVVTKDLPGRHWSGLLEDADCRVEVLEGTEVLEAPAIRGAIGDRCDAVIGQLTERWDAALLETLSNAGGVVYSQYAVGYNNVDVDAATRLRLPVGNTPGVLTETTAQLAVALTFAAARRISEGERYVRAGRFHGWLPDLMTGLLLYRRPLGVIGAGRIGATYARMMVEGHKMDLVYYDVRPNEDLERYVEDYSAFLVSHGEAPVTCRRAAGIDEVLETADVVSLHTVLDASTQHLIGARELALMKEDAILVNSSRGPLVDEAALAAHCRSHPRFFAALDVYEREPEVTEGLLDLDNVVLLPHLGSATSWTRQWMASLAAANVVGMLEGWPVWPPITGLDDARPFLGGEAAPRATPSIVNADELGLARSPGR